MTTHPGLMSEPAWKAGPSDVVSDAQEKGLEVPLGSGMAWMGAQKPEPPLKQKQGLMQAVPL